MKIFRLFVIIIIMLLAIPLFGQETYKYNVGTRVSAIKLLGGTGDVSKVSGWYGLTLTYKLSRKFALETEFIAGENRPREVGEVYEISNHFHLRDGTPYRTKLFPILLNMRYDFRAGHTVSPFFTLGTGVIMWELQNAGDVEENAANISLNTGFGIDFSLTEHFGMETRGRYHRLLGQDKDISGYGDDNTGVLEGSLAMSFRWGKTGTLKKVEILTKETNDMDGIPPSADQCPNLDEDFDNFQDEDGCPDEDNDMDDILDIDDKCPNQTEDMDGFEDEDGCPDLDNDNDGIFDKDDECPNQAEIENGVEDEDGCPDEIPMENPQEYFEQQTFRIFEPIYFESGNATLSDYAIDVLDNVYEAMQRNPEMKIEIHGHSDNVGNRAANARLSLKRAKRAKRYLVERAIDEDRTSVLGFGAEQPIAPNDTEEGRAKNRRVVFIRAN